MRAATVHVTVLDPIPTHAWKLESLDDEIAQISGRYLELIEWRELGSR
ncbi:MAG: hypothetical protein JRH10_00895 [Deltaproteobacteria bacterium]|nr:hypothetical protein [Deltaproteobacteria bacterium]MBW2447303.1 hypothetical protein [Deltaproteobacteria bacterium]